MGTAPRPVVAVLCGDHPPPRLAEVERDADVRYAGTEELPAALGGADVLFVWDFLSTAVERAWPSADEIRWVHIASAGVDRLMFDGLVRSQVVLTNARGVFDRSIAEYVLGLVLAFAKDLPRTVTLQAAMTWQHRETERVDGAEALVVGTGGIGRATAVLLQAVGMHVVGVGRGARSGDPDLGHVHAAAELPALLPSADYVIVTAPLTEQTRGMFDGEAFRRMKPSARLVNVGRGPIVVEKDLVVALEQGQIAGAALDVAVEEPLPADHPLWSTPGVLVSPHMSGDFVGWRDALAEQFVANYRRWRAGQPLRNVVDKDLGYVAGS